MSKYPGIVQIYFKCAKPTFTFTRDVVVLTSNAAKKSYTISFFLSDEKSSYSLTAGSPPGPIAGRAQGGCVFITLAQSHTNTDFVSLSGRPSSFEMWSEEQHGRRQFFNSISLVLS